jgi:CotH protein
MVAGPRAWGAVALVLVWTLGACDAQRELAQRTCDVTLSGPRWVVEGDPVRIAIACATGRQLPPDLAVAGLPPGAKVDVSAGEIRWTTGLADAGVYELVPRVSSEPSGKTFTLGVADRFDAAGNAPPDPARYTEEYGLPVFHLDVPGVISDLEYTAAVLTYRGHIYDVQVKYRGNKSLLFPKKSLTIDFPSEHFSDPALGFFDRKKVLLITTFDDQSYLRDRLVLGLWKNFGGPIWAQTASAVLFLNGEYFGLYTMSEKIAGQVLSRGGLDGDANLYMAQHRTANFYPYDSAGLPKLTWHDGYTKEEGFPLDGEPGAYDDLDAFVRFVVESDDATFAAQLPGLIDLDEYRSWWALVMLTLAIDSANHNSFHYHDPAGGPWRTAIWDCAQSLGQGASTSRTPASTPVAFTEGNNLFRRLLLPPFDQATRARLGDLVQQVPVTDVLAMIDDYAQQDGEAARRDQVRWGTEQEAYFGARGRTDWATYDDEVAYVRQWVRDRWAYLQSTY